MSWFHGTFFHAACHEKNHGIAMVLPYDIAMERPMEIPRCHGTAYVNFTVMSWQCRGTAKHCHGIAMTAHGNVMAGHHCHGHTMTCHGIDTTAHGNATVSHGNAMTDP